MTDHVTPFPRQVVQDTGGLGEYAQYLRTLAAQVEAGNVASIAILVENSAGRWEMWFHAPRPYSAIGAIEDLKRQVFDEMETADG